MIDTGTLDHIIRRDFGRLLRFTLANGGADSLAAKWEAFRMRGYIRQAYRQAMREHSNG